jgi:hypothetical protein
MEQSLSWKAKGRTAIQEIPLFLCKMKDHCRVHTTLVFILSQTNPIHNPQSHILLI